MLRRAIPSLLALAERLTRPAQSLHDMQERRDARLLTALILVFAVVYWATSLLRIVQSYPSEPEPLFVIALLASSVVLTGLYAISRTRHYRTAVGLICVYVGIIVFAMMAADSVLAVKNNSLSYFMLAVVLTGLLLSVRAALLVAVAAVALSALLTHIFAPPDYALESQSMIQMNTIIAGLSVAIAIIQQHYRHTVVHQAQGLAENESRYRTLFEALSDPVVVHQQGVIIQANPAFEQTFGYAPGDVLGHMTTAFFVPEDHALIVEKSLSRDIERYEAVMLHRDGTLIPVEINSRPYSFADEAQRVSILRDIRAHKAVEQKLAEERALLEIVINTIPDQVYVKDTESRFVLGNQALLRRHGFTHQDEVLGKTDFDLFGPEIGQAFFDSERALLAADTDMTVTRDSIETGPDGKPLLFQIKKAVLRDSAGRVVGLVGINRDITERQRTEQQRLDLALERQRVETLRRLIANLSHDLKTPLTVLKTSLYLLSRAPHSGEELERRIEIFEEQVERLNTIVEDMLTYDRLETTTEIPILRKIMAEDLLQPVIAGGHSLAAQYDHTFTTNIEPELPPLMVNATMIQRALGNLLNNAARFTPAGGTISLSVGRNGTGIAIVIRDSGVGIDPADLPNLFDSLYRGDKARSSTTGGSGMGLSIARRIARMHGGDILVESVPGTGSTFTLWLPLLRTTPVTEA